MPTGPAFWPSAVPVTSILIGSLSKMGIGSNVQSRVSHLLDLDAPAGPLQPAQRPNRRQGNPSQR